MTTLFLMKKCKGERYALLKLKSKPKVILIEPIK